MTTVTTPRFKAQTDEVTSLLRIVNMVRNGEARTRPEIGKVTGLGRGVVTQRVDQAIQMGYLTEDALGASSGGRQPRRLRFRAERGLIVICALGVLHVRVGITALEGDILEDIHRTWDISRGPEETLEMVMSLVDEVLKKGPKQPVWSVVVGLPGPVDFATGQPVAPQSCRAGTTSTSANPSWNVFMRLSGSTTT